MTVQPTTLIKVHPDAPLMPVIDVDPDTNDFATPDGRYFVNVQGAMELFHESIHMNLDAVDVTDEAEAGLAAVASFFAHEVLAHVMDALDATAIAIAFGLPAADGHAEPAADPQD